ncbi:hypothetical protein CEXT_35071 [Caerostris extrusa]|uniref:Uncharacterized protein n=1 Tax=Caerostris extrusa TaxID=172846 RepID=A0AAV4VRS4_CAEEX|nr:hypothetical protein CEXT_35071 [Caerostris extrusa]
MKETQTAVKERRESIVPKNYKSAVRQWERKPASPGYRPTFSNDPPCASAPSPPSPSSFRIGIRNGKWLAVHHAQLKKKEGRRKFSRFDCPRVVEKDSFVI